MIQTILAVTVCLGLAAAIRALLALKRELQGVREINNRRVAILEMIASHTSLGKILQEVVGLCSRNQPGSGAAVWSLSGKTLLYQVSSGLPESMTNALRTQSFGCDGGLLSLTKELNKETVEEIGKLASASHLKEAIVPLENAAKDVIGLMLVCVPLSAVPDSLWQKLLAGRRRAPQACKSLTGTGGTSGGTGSGAGGLRPASAGWKLAPPGQVPHKTARGVPLAAVQKLASLAIENALLDTRLALQAQHDPLTGLPNRLLFQDRVQQAILRGYRNRKKVALLWFDVDRLKQVNDTLGHRIGDELLSEFARRLKASIRESDTAARIGGDQFVVLAADLDSVPDAQGIAEKIMKVLRASAAFSGHPLKISASAGISVYPDHGLGPAVLMRNADLAMYQAKRAGRNGFHVFHPELSESLGRRLEIERELGNAIEAREFHLEYQPQIGRDGNLRGLEALLRWNSAKLGVVSPAEFIPVAEEAGLILQIGEWVARAACQEGAKWIRQGLDVPGIAVNASGLQLTDKTFSDMICSTLEESGFPPSKLDLEVTETALVGNLESALQQIEGLRKMGIRFSLDDFGTGYSSLNQLRTLPVDCVKVDRSFVKDLDRITGDSAALVRAIIGMGHNLRLLIVAEGVETEGQLAILRSLGCDVFQGYYFHRPQKSEAAEELMRAYAVRRPHRPINAGEGRAVSVSPIPDLVSELVN